MVDFGYKINKARVIDYDKADLSLFNYVIEHEPSFKLCIGCGACSATCSAGSITNFNIRNLNNLLKRGETELIKNEINKCMFCGKCQLVCPRGVNNRNLIFTIKTGIKTLLP